ncbi:MAG TPA: ATP-binding cassette domain-containing protein [Mycobacteriales bacterium]|nr:ATP-binding cassette domain-containing protein [Mycobacteriales bacterium]
MTVRRGLHAALQDVTWAVHPGERWVVLGGNGAGKTTLSQVVAGGLPVSEGRAELLGEDLATADVDDLAPSVGLCSAAIADLLDVDEKVVDVVLAGAWGAISRGGSWLEDTDDQRARRLLASLGCGALAQRPFGSLSEGERKRVQIARALMADPELLVLDEPAAGLDLGGREALLARLTRLARDPAAPALVLVTHHVEEIPAGFTHALLLRMGRVVGSGPIGTTLTQDALAATFGFPVRLVVDDAGRYSARAAFL